MARSGTWLLLLFLLLSASLCSCLEGRNRKLVLGAQKQGKKVNVNPSSRDNLFLSALPKGTVPSSSPSKKGHAVVVDEKLIARHLISSMDRIVLLSVPSPGDGH